MWWITCCPHGVHKSMDGGRRWMQIYREKTVPALFSNQKHRVKMDGERKQQQNQKKGTVVPFHCFIKHQRPSPQAANQIRGLRDGQPMESRDLVTGISCSPKLWVIRMEIVGSILPCEWSVQLSVTLQIFGDRNEMKWKTLLWYHIWISNKWSTSASSIFNLNYPFHSL